MKSAGAMTYGGKSFDKGKRKSCLLVDATA